MNLQGFLRVLAFYSKSSFHFSNVRKRLRENKDTTSSMAYVFGVFSQLLAGFIGLSSSHSPYFNYFKADAVLVASSETYVTYKIRS